MALYRTVSMSFWTDSKVVDDFTPEDRYFYLYLFTNPHTNLCGCYEISLKQMSLETGYNVETISNLLTRFEQFHNVLRFSRETKEVLILKWYKYNWTASEKLRVPLKREIDSVKNNAFRDYLISIFNGDEERCMDTVSIPYPYGTDTSVTNTVTNTVTDTVTDTTLEERSDKPSKKSPKKPRATKRSFGEYQNVRLTDDEYERLINEFGFDKAEAAIRYLDEYIEEKDYKSRSHNIAIRRWVFDALEEQKKKKTKPPDRANKFANFPQRDSDYNRDMARLIMQHDEGEVAAAMPF